MLKFKTFKGNDIEIDTKKKKIYGGGVVKSSPTTLFGYKKDWFVSG